jgi:hypothetical protein
VTVIPGRSALAPRHHLRCRPARRRAPARGAQLSTLDAAFAVDAMIEFYVDVRADDVRLDDDGDMFLFQWGTWDWVMVRWRRDGSSGERRAMVFSAR